MKKPRNRVVDAISCDILEEVKINQHFSCYRIVEDKRGKGGFMRLDDLGYFDLYDTMDNHVVRFFI